MLIKDKWARIIGKNIWSVIDLSVLLYYWVLESRYLFQFQSESSITFACYFGHDVRNWYGLYTILRQWFVTGHFFFPKAMNKWLCLKVYTEN